MGANAQTAVPAFTAGQVLTAAQMTEVNTGIPVFATTVTRDAAFGGTGEKTLAQGQYAYIEATSTLQVYTGAAWITAGALPGLYCVKEQTAFSAVTTVTLDGIFTSSYSNYLLVINGTATVENDIIFQLRASGVTATTNYNYQVLDSGGGSTNSARITGSSNYRLSTWGVLPNSATTTIFNPQVNQSTTFMTQSYWAQAGSATSPNTRNSSANHSTSAQYDGFIVTIGGGTMTGNYAVYAYSKAVS
jgi:hypothetical protein